MTAGRPTLHARVESWECDFNGHWNTRFYCRSFDAARSVLEARKGRALPGMPPPRRRHLRFHRELTQGDALSIRSCLADGGAIAHVMISEGRVAATALEQAGPHMPDLPDLPRELEGLVLPRGLAVPEVAPWQAAQSGDSLAELGPVRRDELGEDGTLCFEAQIARLATGSHQHMEDVGFRRDTVRKTGIGRMLVELRHRPLSPCGAGELLRMESRIVQVGGKSWISAHLLRTASGRPVAVSETCLLAVDMKERRAAAVPEMIHAAVSAD
ncbi:acyl-ACP thioesterase [Mangrovicoccus ximenensis]|uniref:acyl-ACP thioesterase n=1 Tax=Mangrovicoccus ximenensis TaxID=1911570 RepID=UPI0011AE6CB0|nr:acyl-ACP thioesterase [Mangrovicoccus ximenensis]